MHHANQAVAIGTEAITIVNKSIRELPICELIDGKEYLQDHNHNVRLHKFLANLKMLLLNLAHLLINKCTWKNHLYSYLSEVYLQIVKVNYWCSFNVVRWFGPSSLDYTALIRFQVFVLYGLGARLWFYWFFFFNYHPLLLFLAFIQVLNRHRHFEIIYY